jgi:beta-lactamase class A
MEGMLVVESFVNGGGDASAKLQTGRAFTRRRALGAGSAGIAAALGAAGFAPGVRAQAATPTAAQAQPGNQDGLSQEVVEAFNTLPGQKGLKLWAPADAGRPEWSAEIEPDRELFIASAFKAFVLAETLRLEEESLDPRGETPLARQLNARLAQQLPLNEEVFSLSAPVMNPPNLTGQVTLRTALEAMIARSDNTATDIALKHVRPERVRAFIDGIGLRQSRIPDSTRQFFGYIFGLPDWRATTWADQLADDPANSPRPILNDTITMASTPDELVSFYSRALQGEFFRYAETLAVFRAILGLADAIAFSMPLGVSGFGKGGSIDVEESEGATHVLTFAGGLYVPDRWVSFALLNNWTDADAGPTSEVMGQYIAAARTIFTLVRDRLGG